MPLARPDTKLKLNVVIEFLSWVRNHLLATLAAVAACMLARRARQRTCMFTALTSFLKAFCRELLCCIRSILLLCQVLTWHLRGEFPSVRNARVIRCYGGGPLSVCVDVKTRYKRETDTQRYMLKSRSQRKSTLFSFWPPIKRNPQIFRFISVWNIENVSTSKFFFPWFFFFFLAPQ